MKFDVVIPIRNGENYVIECLDSLVSQVNIGRIIVINDGSTDASATLIDRYIKHHSNIEMHTTKPRGVSAARNLGVKFTESEYIAFLDSDDYWLSDKLIAHSEHLSLHNNCVYSFSQAVSLNDDTNALWNQGNNLGINGCLNDILLQNFVIWGSASSVVVSRAAFDLVGGFNENLEIGEDWELWVRLSELSNPCEISRPLVAIRIHKTSTQHIERMGDARFLASETYCLVWQRYPQIFKDLRFKSRAKEILWGDITRHIKVSFFINREYDSLISRNFPQVYKNLKSKWHSFLAITILLHMLKNTIGSFFCAKDTREN